MNVTVNQAITIGQMFSSFKELEEAIHKTCKDNFIQFYRSDSKTIESVVRKNAPNHFNPDVVYAKVKYACIHGQKCRSTSGRGYKHRFYRRRECAAFIRAVVTNDGQQLIINGICNTHNHPIQKNTVVRSKKIKAALEENLKKIRVRIAYDTRTQDVKPIDFLDVFLEQKLKPQRVSFTYRGLCAPVFNVFNQDLSVNLGVIPDYAKFLADNGITGVLVHGTTGEGMSMTVAERKSVTEEWVKAVKSTKLHLMVQVGGCPLPDVLKLARHAEQVGVDSILCLPELYFKPSTPQELINYLKIVGEAAPKTPLLYYHIPAWSGVNINMANFLNESIGKIPTFHGIKYTSNDLDGGAAALRANNRKYAVFLGADTLLAAAFTLGFDSAIATTFNIIPRYSVKILEAINSSDVDKARAVQKKLSAVCSVITKNGAWVPTMKVAMNLVTPIRVGLARPPLQNLTNEQSNEMRNALIAESVL